MLQNTLYAIKPASICKIMQKCIAIFIENICKPNLKFSYNLINVSNLFCPTGQCQYKLIVIKIITVHLKKLLESIIVLPLDLIDSIRYLNYMLPSKLNTRLPLHNT